MANQFFKLVDTINGTQATARMIRTGADGTTVVEDLFVAKDLRAKVEVKTTDGYTLGNRAEQHKPNGWTGSGTLNLYLATSVFRTMLLSYIKKGIPIYFDLQVENEDPASTLGLQTVILRHCLLKNLDVAAFDINAETLDEAVEFTFDDIDMLNEFQDPVLGSL